MMLSTAQKATLLQNIQATPEAAQLRTDGNLDGLAAYYNQPASPAFWAWRSFVSDSEIYEETSPDGTTWSWTIYIARSQGERDAWRQMVNMRGGLNASLANTRAGIADIFSGGGGAAQRTHLLAMGRRVVTRLEKVFASGTGSAASPANLTVEGPLSAADVIGL